MFISKALTRIFLGLQDTVVGQLRTLFVLGWDTLLQVGNAVTFNKSSDLVIAEGKPGWGGLWPAYEPPTKKDSRSPCPALNAMANHGILPRDGRSISIRALGPAIHQTYNFSNSFCFFTLNYMAEMLQKSYAHDTFDLSDLLVHNGIEHDASLTRYDVTRQPDQSVPAQDLVDQLLASATARDDEGKPMLTVADLSRFATERRDHSRATNGQYTLSTFHKLFGSSNSSTLVTIYGGRVEDLAVILKEERIPDGWQSRVLGRNGLTILGLNATVLRLELGIEERRGPRTVRLT